LGSVKIDTSQKERSLDAKYPALDNPQGLRILLGDLHALKSRQYAGDYDATVILLDLYDAIERAGLTDRQRQAIDLVYGEDLTQKDAGERLGIAQNTLSEALERALENIAEVYFYWARHGEGYSVGTNTRMEAE
jgi:RNA polymerase sigma factor (sigma-70 family)